MSVCVSHHYTRTVLFSGEELGSAGGRPGRVGPGEASEEPKMLAFKGT